MGSAFGIPGWEILLVAALGGWIGWWGRDYLLRRRDSEHAARWQTRLEQATRQSEAAARSLQSEVSRQHETLQKLRDVLSEGRGFNESARAGMSDARSLARHLRRSAAPGGSPEEWAEPPPALDDQARLDAESDRREKESLEAQLTACLERLQTGQEQLVDLKARSQKLDLQLEVAVRKELEAANRAQRLEADLEASHEALFKCDERVTEREGQIEQLQAQLAGFLKHPPTGSEADFEARYRTLVAEKDRRLGDLETEIARLELELEQGGRAAAEKDDLKKIRGIGPGLERLLNDLGITAYHQIALWDDAEIDRISARLGRFRSRIRRDDWVGGAREQYHEKYVDIDTSDHDPAVSSG